MISRVLSVNTDRPMVGIYFVRSSDLYKKLYDHTLKFLLYSTITALANRFSRSFERDESHRLQNERKICIFKRHKGKIKRCVLFEFQYIAIGLKTTKRNRKQCGIYTVPQIKGDLIAQRLQINKHTKQLGTDFIFPEVYRSVLYNGYQYVNNKPKV